MERPMSDEKNLENANSKMGRRGFLTAAAGTVAATAVASSAITTTAEAQTISCATVAGSVAWKQPGNNRHMLELVKETPPAAQGQVSIDYFGHCAFKITSPMGLTMMFDPWRNDESGVWGLWFPKDFPKTVVDLCVSTHTHFDHDALYNVDATSVLDRTIGSWSFADVKITGIPDKHATDCPGSYKWINAVKEFGADPYPPNNPGHLDMVSFVVETGGMRILIWGDNRHNAPDDVWKTWGKIDVLTLPVDGSWHVLSYEQGDAIVDRLKPKIVIPTHYRAPGISSTLSTLQTADDYVKGQKRKHLLSSSKLTLSSESIASMDGDFHYFGSNANHGSII
jgi:L-ascorbate metabolism protein UlaG (beta-lactamase superfamily)